MTETRRRTWQPDWRLWVFCGLLLPLLVGLGIWQLQRAAEKQQQLDQWQQTQEQLIWGIQSADSIQPGQPVTVSGYYTGMTWLLDNRTRNGVAGYEVLTVFEPVSGEALVVNRGWVQAPPRRMLLPMLPQPEGLVRIKGRLSEYPEPPVLAETADSGDWPRRVQKLTAAKAEAERPGVAPLVLRLEGSALPGAFRTGWAPDRMGPQTHYGYAAQWIALAITLVVLTLMASYRQTQTEASNDNDNG